MAQAYLGNTVLNQTWLGNTQINDVIIPEFNIIIGNGASSIPNQTALESKLSGETINKFVLLNGNVYANSTTDFSIVNNAFNNDNNITFFYSDKAVSIGFTSFVFCDNLKFINVPNCTSISTQGVALNPLLTSVIAPKLNSVLGGALGSNALSSIDYPLLENLSSELFKENQLTIVNLPNAKTSSGNLTFSNNFILPSISLPLITNLVPSMFGNNNLLSFINVPLLSGSNALGGTPGNNSVFTNTAISGSITIPIEYATNNAGSPDGDVQYLIGRGWTVNYV